MPFAVVGLNHRTAPIEVRERVAFAPSAVQGALADVLAGAGVFEAALVSTCNRTEFYLHVNDPEPGIDRAVRVLAEQAGELPKPVARYLYVRRDADAVEHLYRVTAGLDSMVLGEVQIQGQVKEAYEIARNHSGSRPAVGSTFNRLFQTALSVGSRVRTETRISEGAASVPSAAVDLARKIFGSLGGRRGMVIGAGDMGELTLQCLVAEGMESVIVANRNLDRAQELAGAIGGEALAYTDLWDRLPAMDIIISSTAAPHAVITIDQFRSIMPSEPRSPLFIVDIAIPRDIDPAIGEHPNVFLYNIDDLQNIVSANLERRNAEIPLAEKIIAEGVDGYWRWYSGLRAVPLIRRMRERAEDVRRLELERLDSQLDHLSEADRAHIDRLTRRLLKKLLHSPTARMREAAEDGRDRGILEAARYLFDIDEEDEPAEE